EDRCNSLNLNMMVENNTVLHHTQFTVSVDLIGHGCTTGISVHDRAKTIQALVDETTKPGDLGRPGHIFPLRAKEGGVLRRTGHTEAAIDLARLAGLQPAGILVEILNEDGTMARLPQLMEVAKKFDLKLISIEDLVAYRMEHDSLIRKEEDFTINTKFGSFRLRAYKQTTNDQVHIALTKGDWKKEEPVLVRVNATLVNGDILGTLTNNAEQKLDDMFNVINSKGKGAIVFINQQSQSLNLLQRLKELRTAQRENEIAKAPRIAMDSKDFGIGAQILHDLGIHKIQLLSNSEQTKRVGMIGYGLEITEYVNY
ncbi:MAG: 3,4-dihydroxy-2-butanone-4-phosphate synthase, partial [Altibacter sp.]|nr:3,4-dihydroxy-2-butanone-4-phosphate synthase [Altibacter sp.]